ncbi:hypothetical protein CEXT_225471 [Caerostris extrusa]|uniref:Uncharacterized protein n=1 Tax=Caerostris extrusa TaxID=172846 RepID=A0AAV4PRF9_CAEEX|nr:hypothetical protein CEXT_225471 [Caerostris extrusa]
MHLNTARPMPVQLMIPAFHSGATSQPASSATPESTLGLCWGSYFRLSSGHEGSLKVPFLYGVHGNRLIRTRKRCPIFPPSFSWGHFLDTAAGFYLGKIKFPLLCWGAQLDAFKHDSATVGAAIDPGLPLGSHFIACL